MEKHISVAPESEVVANLTHTFDGRVHGKDISKLYSVPIVLLVPIGSKCKLPWAWKPCLSHSPVYIRLRLSRCCTSRGTLDRSLHLNLCTVVTTANCPLVYASLFRRLDNERLAPVLLYTELRVPYRNVVFEWPEGVIG